MVVAFKEIRLAAFDPDYGAALGLPAWVSELAINTAAALAVVAAFRRRRFNPCHRDADLPRSIRPTDHRQAWQRKSM